VGQISEPLKLFIQLQLSSHASENPDKDFYLLIGSPKVLQMCLFTRFSFSDINRPTSHGWRACVVWGGRQYIHPFLCSLQIDVRGMSI